MGASLRVVAAVFERDGLVLACRRKPEKAAGGKWEFPGGKVEDGETAEEALQRELTEELNCKISTVGPLITRSFTEVDQASIDLACYWVQSDEIPQQSTDHDELRWCTLDRLELLDWAEPDLPAVRTIRRTLTTEGTQKKG